MNRLGALGCLPLALLAVSLLARQWRWLWVVVPLLVVVWLPIAVLRQGRRYKEVERRVSEIAKARADYVFIVTPSDRQDLAGGFLRV